MRARSILCLALLIACSDDTTGDAGEEVPVDASTDAAAAMDAGPLDIDGGRPSVVLGLGIVDFNMAEDGDSAELVAGPQGGWHVDVALQLYNVEPDGAVLTLQGFDVVSGDPLTVPIARRLTRSRVRRVDDHWLRLGDQMVFNVDDPSEVADRDVRLRATLAEADGRETIGELRVHVVDRVE